jgi:hypothetical protein
LGYAASVSGSSAESLQSSLSSLTTKIGDAALKGSQEFSRLGISVFDAVGNVKKADQVIFEIADRFKSLNLSLPQQKSFLSSFGIDSNTLKFLNKSREEVQKLIETAKKLGTISDQDSKKIEVFNNSITTLKFGLDSVRTQIAVGLAPAIQSMVKTFTDWLIANKELIAQGLEKTFAFISKLSQGISRLLVFINDIVEATVGWKVVVIALVAAFAILNPITAAIGAILLIVDDLIVAFKGGKSVIREFFLEFFGFDITPVLRFLVDGFKGAVAVIKDFFFGLFDFITNGINKIIEFVKFIGNVFGGGTTAVVGAGNSTSPSQQPNVSAGNGVYIPDYNSAPKNSENYVTQNVKIDIKTTDPVLAGKSVNDNLQNQLQNANSQLNNGGR